MVCTKLERKQVESYDTSMAETVLATQGLSDVDSEVEMMEENPIASSRETRPRRRRHHTNIFGSLCHLPCLSNHTDTYSIQNASTPPKDRFNLVYIAFLITGAGFLFPWNSFITAVDYFRFLYQEEFREVSEAIPLSYLLTSLLLAVVNISLVGVFPIHARISYGYIMFIIALLFVPLLDIGINNCTVSTHVSYYLTILSVVVVGLGSGVQQSSLYGLSSMLPRKYSQAIMAGESVAGVAVSINRIITKSAIKSERISVISFFGISLVFIIFCVGCHCFIRTSPFVKYHTARCMRQKKDQGGDVQGEIPLEDHTSHHDEAAVVSDDAESEEKQLISDPVREVQSTQWRNKFLRKIEIFSSVFKQIWELIVAISTCYFVTLLVFPGLISEIQYCEIGDWMPIILITIFNFSDFVAKWLALLPLKWSPRALMVSSLLRVLIVPLLVLCVSPSPTYPVLGDSVVGVSVLLAFVLGITNGYFGSLPLINVSQSVKEEAHRELAGTIMVFMLLLGLSLGSVMSYAVAQLTKIADYYSCNVTEHHFDLCDHGNITM